MNKTLKNILYGIGIASTVALTSCGTSKQLGQLDYKLVDEITTNNFSRPYNQMNKIMELTDSLGTKSQDNENNNIITYQIKANGLVEYEVQNAKGKVEKEPKVEEHSLEAVQLNAKDTIDNTYTAQIVQSNTAASASKTKDKKGETNGKYFILSGTNIYNDGYVEMYKIKMNGDKLSTKEEDWAFQVTNVKTSESSGFLPYNTLKDETKSVVEKRINYINAIYFPNNTPATKGIELIIGEGVVPVKNATPAYNSSSKTNTKTNSNSTPEWMK